MWRVPERTSSVLADSQLADASVEERRNDATTPWNPRPDGDGFSLWDLYTSLSKKHMTDKEERQINKLKYFFSDGLNFSASHSSAEKPQDVICRSCTDVVTRNRDLNVEIFRLVDPSDFQKKSDCNKLESSDTRFSETIIKTEKEDCDHLSFYSMPNKISGRYLSSLTKDDIGNNNSKSMNSFNFVMDPSVPIKTECIKEEDSSFSEDCDSESSVELLGEFRPSKKMRNLAKEKGRPLIRSSVQLDVETNRSDKPIARSRRRKIPSKISTTEYLQKLFEGPSINVYSTNPSSPFYKVSPHRAESTRSRRRRANRRLQSSCTIPHACSCCQTNTSSNNIDNNGIETTDLISHTPPCLASLMIRQRNTIGINSTPTICQLPTNGRSLVEIATLNMNIETSEHHKSKLSEIIHSACCHSSHNTPFNVPSEGGGYDNSNARSTCGWIPQTCARNHLNVDSSVKCTLHESAQVAEVTQPFSINVKDVRCACVPQNRNQKLPSENRKTENLSSTVIQQGVSRHLCSECGQKIPRDECLKKGRLETKENKSGFNCVRTAQSRMFPSIKHPHDCETRPTITLDLESSSVSTNDVECIYESASSIVPSPPDNVCVGHMVHEKTAKTDNLVSTALNQGVILIENHISDSSERNITNSVNINSQSSESVIVSSVSSLENKAVNECAIPTTNVNKDPSSSIIEYQNLQMNTVPENINCAKERESNSMEESRTETNKHIIDQNPVSTHIDKVPLNECISVTRNEVIDADNLTTTSLLSEDSNKNVDINFQIEESRVQSSDMLRNKEKHPLGSEVDNTSQHEVYRLQSSKKLKEFQENKNYKNNSLRTTSPSTVDDIMAEKHDDSRETCYIQSSEEINESRKSENGDFSRSKTPDILQTIADFFNEIDCSLSNSMSNDIEGNSEKYDQKSRGRTKNESCKLSFSGTTKFSLTNEGTYEISGDKGVLQSKFIVNTDNINYLSDNTEPASEDNSKYKTSFQLIKENNSVHLDGKDTIECISFPKENTSFSERYVSKESLNSSMERNNNIAISNSERSDNVATTNNSERSIAIEKIILKATDNVDNSNKTETSFSTIEASDKCDISVPSVKDTPGHSHYCEKANEAVFHISENVTKHTQVEVTKNCSNGGTTLTPPVSPLFRQEFTKVKRSCTIELKGPIIINSLPTSCNALNNTHDEGVCDAEKKQTSQTSLNNCESELTSNFLTEIDGTNFNGLHKATVIGNIHPEDNINSVSKSTDSSSSGPQVSDIEKKETFMNSFCNIFRSKKSLRRGARMSSRPVIDHNKDTSCARNAHFSSRVLSTIDEKECDLDSFSLRSSNTRVSRFSQIYSSKWSPYEVRPTNFDVGRGRFSGSRMFFHPLRDTIPSDLPVKPPDLSWYLSLKRSMTKDNAHVIGLDTGSNKHDSHRVSRSSNRIETCTSKCTLVPISGGESTMKISTSTNHISIVRPDTELLNNNSEVICNSNCSLISNSEEVSITQTVSFIRNSSIDSPCPDDVLPTTSEDTSNSYDSLVVNPKAVASIAQLDSPCSGDVLPTTSEDTNNSCGSLVVNPKGVASIAQLDIPYSGDVLPTTSEDTNHSCCSLVVNPEGVSSIAPLDNHYPSDALPTTSEDTNNSFCSLVVNPKGVASIAQLESLYPGDVLPTTSEDTNNSGCSLIVNPEGVASTAQLESPYSGDVLPTTSEDTNNSCCSLVVNTEGVVSTAQLESPYPGDVLPTTSEDTNNSCCSLVVNTEGVISTAQLESLFPGDVLPTTSEDTNNSCRSLVVNPKGLASIAQLDSPCSGDVLPTTSEDTNNSSCSLVVNTEGVISTAQLESLFPGDVLPTTSEDTNNSSCSFVVNPKGGESRAQIDSSISHKLIDDTSTDDVLSTNSKVSSTSNCVVSNSEEEACTYQTISSISNTSIDNPCLVDVLPTSEKASNSCFSSVANPGEVASTTNTDSSINLTFINSPSDGEVLPMNSKVSSTSNCSLVHNSEEKSSIVKSICFISPVANNSGSPSTVLPTHSESTTIEENLSSPQECNKLLERPSVLLDSQDTNNAQNVHTSILEIVDNRDSLFNDICTSPGVKESISSSSKNIPNNHTSIEAEWSKLPTNYTHVPSSASHEANTTVRQSCTVSLPLWKVKQVLLKTDPLYSVICKGSHNFTIYNNNNSKTFIGRKGVSKSKEKHVISQTQDTSNSITMERKLRSPLRVTKYCRKLQTFTYGSSSHFTSIAQKLYLGPTRGLHKKFKKPHILHCMDNDTCVAYRGFPTSNRRRRLMNSTNNVSSKIFSNSSVQNKNVSFETIDKDDESREKSPILPIQEDSISQKDIVISGSTSQISCETSNIDETSRNPTKLSHLGECTLEPINDTKCDSTTNSNGTNLSTSIALAAKETTNAVMKKHTVEVATLTDICGKLHLLNCGDCQSNESCIRANQVDNVAKSDKTQIENYICRIHSLDDKERSLKTHISQDSLKQFTVTNIPQQSKKESLSASEKLNDCLSYIESKESRLLVGGDTCMDEKQPIGKTIALTISDDSAFAEIDFEPELEGISYYSQTFSKSNEEVDSSNEFSMFGSFVTSTSPSRDTTEVNSSHDTNGSINQIVCRGVGTRIQSSKTGEKDTSGKATDISDSIIQDITVASMEPDDECTDTEPQENIYDYAHYGRRFNKWFFVLQKCKGCTKTKKAADRIRERRKHLTPSNAESAKNEESHSSHGDECLDLECITLNDDTEGICRQAESVVDYVKDSGRRPSKYQSQDKGYNQDVPCSGNHPSDPRLRSAWYMARFQYYPRYSRPAVDITWPQKLPKIEITHDMLRRSIRREQLVDIILRQSKDSNKQGSTSLKTHFSYDNSRSNENTVDENPTDFPKEDPRNQESNDEDSSCVDFHVPGVGYIYDRLANLSDEVISSTSPLESDSKEDSLIAKGTDFSSAFTGRFSTSDARQFESVEEIPPRDPRLHVDTSCAPSNLRPCVTVRGVVWRENAFGGDTVDPRTGSAARRWSHCLQREEAETEALRQYSVRMRGQADISSGYTKRLRAIRVAAETNDSHEVANEVSRRKDRRMHKGVPLNKRWKSKDLEDKKILTPQQHPISSDTNAELTSVPFRPSSPLIHSLSPNVRPTSPCNSSPPFHSPSLFSPSSFIPPSPPFSRTSSWFSPTSSPFSPTSPTCSSPPTIHSPSSHVHPPSLFCAPIPLHPSFPPFPPLFPPLGRQVLLANPSPQEAFKRDSGEAASMPEDAEKAGSPMSPFLCYAKSIHSFRNKSPPNPLPLKYPPGLSLPSLSPSPSSSCSDVLDFDKIQLCESFLPQEHPPPSKLSLSEPVCGPTSDIPVNGCVARAICVPATSTFGGDDFTSLPKVDSDDDVSSMMSLASISSDLGHISPQEPPPLPKLPPPIPPPPPPTSPPPYPPPDLRKVINQNDTRS